MLNSVTGQGWGKIRDGVGRLIAKFHRYSEDLSSLQVAKGPSLKPGTDRTGPDQNFIVEERISN